MKVNPELLIPNADIRNYYLIWFPDTPEKCKSGVVGIIGNDTNEKIKIKLLIDDQYLKDHNLRNCVLNFSPKPKKYETETEIVLGSSFFERARDTNHPAIWHEIGHYQTNRYFPEYIGSGQSALRVKYIDRGEVYPAELVADLVAVYYAEKEPTMQDLRKLASERYAISKMEDLNSSKAWWELRTRRKALQKIQGDQDIEEELCRLCGVSSIDQL